MKKSPIRQVNGANAAVYIIEPTVIEFLISLNKEIIDFSTEVLPHYLNRMQIFQRNTDYHRDIGTPESFAFSRDGIFYLYPKCFKNRGRCGSGRRRGRGRLGSRG